MPVQKTNTIYTRRTGIQLLCLVIILVTIPSLLWADDSYSRAIQFNKNKVEIHSFGSALYKPKIGLVLSGGGARGIVHIGVLKILEEHNIPIDLIVGTSVGGFIGALYASGYTPAQIEQIIESYDWNDIYQDKTQRSSLYMGQKNIQDRYLLSIRFNGFDPYIPSAYSPGQRVMTILSGLFLKAKYQPRNDFDNLKVPFRAVATDLVSGKQIVLGKGNLAESINASLAVPLLFSPVKVDSMLLVDGGLLANLPVNVARDIGMDKVIAVDVSGRLRSSDEIEAPWEIVDQATTIMAELSKKMQSMNTDILIKPELGDISNSDFSQIKKLIAAGENSTLDELPRIKTLLAVNPERDENELHVSVVEYENNHQELPYEIYKDLHVQINKNITKKDILEDLDTFISSGYFKKVSARLDTVLQSVRVVYKLERFNKVKKITFLGVSKYSKEKLMKVINTAQAKPFNTQTFQADLDSLTNLYRSDGYSLMRVKKIDWDDEIGELTITVDEGRIGQIEVTGNEKTNNYVILRDFSGQQGNVFNREKIDNAVRNVYSTQLFERVNVNIIEHDEKNDLEIKVKERSSLIMRLGGKIDTDRGGQAYIEFGDENMLGTGIKTRLSGRIGTKDKYLGLHIRDDRIFVTYLTFRLKTYYSHQINPFTIDRVRNGEYWEQRVGTTFSVGIQLRSLGQLSGEIRFEHIKDKTIKPDSEEIQDLELRTFAVRSITDERDRIDFPTKGIYNHWAWETGVPLILEGQESFTRAVVNLEGYFSPHINHTWHLRMSVGVGDKTLPFSENFRMGGLNNFYGLLENEYYGRQLFITSAEYRFRIPFHLKNKTLLLHDVYLSARYDFGGIWDNPNLVFSSDDFFSGVGAAIAFDTFFGPLYFAWGRTTRGESAGYISWGLTF